MRITLIFLSVIFSNYAGAKTYYFSATSGNDSRTSSQAQSSSTPWKTINKLNSVFSILEPGDSVLFSRGDIFYGSVKPTASGTLSQPIVIGAYGSGDKPVITGMLTLSDWTSIGNGKYESYNPSLGDATNVVTLNNVQYAMGRYPNRDAANGGYLNFESHGTNFITDDQLSSPAAWTGAELVVRTNRYVIDRVNITSHSGTKISYSPALSYEPIDGFGYFVQNDISTLDQVGEWYYNPDSKKMTVYFGSQVPDIYDVKASAVDNVVYVYDMSNIQFDNIAFTGGNKYTVYLYSADNIVIKNCDITFSGVDGISANNTNDLVIKNSQIRYSNNIGINLSNSVDGIIRSNKISNTSLLQGLGQNTANKSLGIRETGQNNLIEYNQVDSSGYIGIRFGGDYCIVKNNLVNYFNLIKDDGGGIYTSSTDDSKHYGQKITGNIVLNGIGAAEGTNILIAGSTSGIYLDDYTNNLDVTNNTVAFCNKAGILIHNAHDIDLLQNTVFNNHNQQLLLSHNLTEPNSAPLRNNTIKNNILFSKDASQGVVNISSVKNDISLTGNMDSNYYCRPLDDNFVVKTTFVNSEGTTVRQDCDLQGWQAYYKKDLATKKTAVQVVPHKVNALIGSNKFTNGAFNIDITGPNIYSTGTSFVADWVTNKIDGGTLQVVTASTKPGMTTITIPVGEVSTARQYIISFSVKNSEDTLLYVYARQAGAPYKVLSNDGVKTILRMGPARKDFELAFTPTLDEANATIFLETPSQTNTWWLDNVKIYEADVTETNPDDSIRFEYNAGQSAKTIGLNGTYVDATGNVYTDNITLQPYSSAVLVRKGDQPVSGSQPTVSLISPSVSSTYNASATVSLIASAKDADGTIKKVEFYNGTELLHTEFIDPYTFSWENVPAGDYIITARAVDNDGNIATSTEVPISVVESGIPKISLISPILNSIYTAPSTVTITATATDPDGISKVEFYSGNDLLHTEVTAPYTWPWENVPAGIYIITAKATSKTGTTTVSSNAVITVLPSILSLAPPQAGSQAISEDAKRPGAPDVAKPAELKLYPNPVIDKVQLSLAGLQYNQRANISIIDLLGKVVKNIPVIYAGQNIEIDVSALSTGMYVLRVTGENFTVNKKFLKKN